MNNKRKSKSSLSGQQISRKEALRGLGNPKDWPKESAAFYKEIQQHPVQLQDGFAEVKMDDFDEIRCLKSENKRLLSKIEVFQKEVKEILSIIDTLEKDIKSKEFWHDLGYANGYSDGLKETKKKCNRQKK